MCASIRPGVTTVFGTSVAVEGVTWVGDPVVDVYQAIESGPVFAMHRATPDPECVVGHGIGPVMTTVYDDVEAALRRELAKTTLEDVLRNVLKAA